MILLWSSNDYLLKNRIQKHQPNTVFPSSLCQPPFNLDRHLSQVFRNNIILPIFNLPLKSIHLKNYLFRLSYLSNSRIPWYFLTFTLISRWKTFVFLTIKYKKCKFDLFSHKILDVESCRRYKNQKKHTKDFVIDYKQKKICYFPSRIIRDLFA